jgi:hypothetical protein
MDFLLLPAAAPLVVVGGRAESALNRCGWGCASLAPLGLLPGAPDMGRTEMAFRRKLAVWVPLLWVRVGWSCFFYPLPLL